MFETGADSACSRETIDPHQAARSRHTQLCSLDRLRHVSGHEHQVLALQSNAAHPLLPGVLGLAGLVLDVLVLACIRGDGCRYPCLEGGSSSEACKVIAGPVHTCQSSYDLCMLLLCKKLTCVQARQVPPDLSITSRSSSSIVSSTCCVNYFRAGHHQPFSQPAGGSIPGVEVHLAGAED